MNDFYSAASQVIPVLLLAMVVEVPRAGLPWPRRVVIGIVVAALVAELLALGGLSFDEEDLPVLNRIVAAAVWLVVLALLVLLVATLVSHVRTTDRRPPEER